MENDAADNILAVAHSRPVYCLFHVTLEVQFNVLTKLTSHLALAHGIRSKKAEQSNNPFKIYGDENAE